MVNIYQQIYSYAVTTSPSATDIFAHSLAFSHYCSFFFSVMHAKGKNRAVNMLLVSALVLMWLASGSGNLPCT
jgi:hypothetical protein